MFAANQGNQGRDFVNRAIMLSVSILIKRLVIMFFIGFCIGVLAAMAGEVEDDVISPWFGLVFSSLLQILYFWRLYVHLRFINTE